MNMIKKMFFKRINFQGKWNVFTITESVNFLIFLLITCAGIGFTLYYNLKFLSLWVMSANLLIPLLIMMYVLNRMFTKMEWFSFKRLVKDICTMPIYMALILGCCSGLEKTIHIDKFTILLYLCVIPITNRLYALSFHIKRNFHTGK